MTSLHPRHNIGSLPKTLVLRQWQCSCIYLLMINARSKFDSISNTIRIPFGCTPFFESGSRTEFLLLVLVLVQQSVLSLRQTEKSHYGSKQNWSLVLLIGIYPGKPRAIPISAFPSIHGLQGGAATRIIDSQSSPLIIRPRLMHGMAQKVWQTCSFLLLSFSLVAESISAFSSELVSKKTTFNGRTDWIFTFGYFLHR